MSDVEPPARLQARLWEWAQVGSVLCLETDQGSVARVEVTGFGACGPPVYGPPKLIEFSATLWAPIPDLP